MVRPGRDRLSGRIEVDETYLGSLMKEFEDEKPSKKP